MIIVTMCVCLCLILYNTGGCPPAAAVSLGENWVFAQHLIAILHYLEAKFDYGYFIFFLRYGSKILHKKTQFISSKNDGVTAIFLNFDFILNLKNQRHGIIFAWNDLKFFV